MMGLIVGANTAQTVRMIEQRLGRPATDAEFEGLTLAMARNAEKSTAIDYVAAQTAAFQISRVLYEFLDSCDVFLSPTLCRLPLPLGELNSMSERFLAYSADSAQLHPGHCDVQYVRSARDVGAACLEPERIADRHDVRRAFWRGGDIISFGGTARAGTPMEGQTAAGLR